MGKDRAMAWIALTEAAFRQRRRLCKEWRTINQIFSASPAARSESKESDHMNSIQEEILVIAPQSAANHKIIGSVRSRAELLANRIEEGASRLGAFAEDLSDAQWRTPISATDRRTVGVIVHHVASMYPIEIDLARTVASGKAAPEVTWELVAEINARHAEEQAEVTKAAALELLRRNSRGAAAAVRAFRDEDLDGSAPVGLSSGAPVTAQFIIEDHALRHSWHHLAGIRRVVGR
jgi:hypothetical protein